MSAAWAPVRRQLEPTSLAIETFAFCSPQGMWIFRVGIACMPFFIYVTEGVGGYAAPRDLLFSYPNTLNDPYWQPTHVARDLMIALMPVARGLPGKMMMLSTLAQGTAAQPVGAFGNRGPNRYVNAIGMADFLRAEHRVNDLLHALAHLLRSRDDEHYMQYAEVPMADFLQALGGEGYPGGALPILHDHVMHWARYVEGCLFEEYMNVWFPHQQLRFRHMEGSGPGSLLQLPPTPGENEAARARRLHYNYKRNMSVEIAVLHGHVRPGLNRDIDLPVAPPSDETATWMLEAIDFVRTARLEGHHGWALDRLQNRIRGMTSGIADGRSSTLRRWPHASTRHNSTGWRRRSMFWTG